MCKALLLSIMLLKDPLEALSRFAMQSQMVALEDERELHFRYLPEAFLHASNSHLA
jgi:hypothetical protein